MRFPSWPVFLLAFTCGALAETSIAPPSPTALLQQGNARIVLVGDSITGQSRNHPAGFAHQIDWALQQVYPGCHPAVVALGGSGAGVQGWLNTEKRSRTEAFPLDVKGLEVKTELDRPADVLVIMLGMNDVLAPYVVDEPASLDKWTTNYRELIIALQRRLRPKVTAVATATLCTEDEASPKNVMMHNLNEHLESLAKEMRLVTLPAHATMLDVLLHGRQWKPDFHVTHDYVHPNEAGHLAIAAAMLRGLGEERAARTIEDQKLAKILDLSGRGLPFSSLLRFLPAGANERKRLYADFPLPARTTGKVEFGMKASREDWDIVPLQPTPRGLPFWVDPIKNSAELHENALTLKVQGRVIGTVPIPAPWMVATGLIRKPWNEHQPLNGAAFHGPVEDAIENGGSPLGVSDAAPGQQLHWEPYRASIDFTGGADPDSVDFAAVTHARPFEAGYGARWIHSDRDRPVNVELSTQTFAGVMQLNVWLNGAQVYSGLINAEPGKRKTVPAQLHAGWNTLVFCLNHITWQMQCTVKLAPVGDDSLDDLRYSITPQEAVSK